MQNEKTKVVVIGTGGWGRRHARVFAQRPDVDFRAVLGHDKARAEARASEYNLRAYTDLQAMLAREQPDLVSVCLPNEGHFAPTLAVIQAGYSLLVEKPLVFVLAEADVLLWAAEARALFFAINFSHRYAQPTMMAKDAIDQGRLGEIVFATWRFGGEGDSSHPYANLIKTQCHAFDLLEHLCGPIASVMAEMTGKTHKGFSTMALSLRFASGAVGSFLGTYDSPYAYPQTQPNTGRRDISTTKTVNSTGHLTHIWRRCYRRSVPENATGICSGGQASIGTGIPSVV